MNVTGKGSPTLCLTEEQVTGICAEAFAQMHLDNKKILAIIPDTTRTGPIGMMFRVVHGLLAGRVRQLDVLIALGTHPPLSDDAINRHLSITAAERSTKYRNTRIFNHQWKNPEALRRVGTISAEEVEEISGGLMHRPVETTINKMVFDYDLLLIIGPTFPHEVVGFSGGNKYLFPGISGQEIIDMFHWLGALITSPAIIGTMHTPVRAVIDRAASLLPLERLCMSLVVRGGDLAGLFVGTPEEAWESAASLSDQIHIVYKDRPYKKVLSCAPMMYDELWVGGKCTYKLEPVVADGGELIIYAPHMKEISVTHGAIIRQIGYHVRDYFLNQMEKFRGIPPGVMAHSTHVKGVGTFDRGVERPRMNVVLATGIPGELCKAINLGYKNPDAIDVEQWKDREDEGTLYVAKAGEILFRLKNDPFRNGKNGGRA
jgi:nickel-dependent lactate racemase